MFNKRSPFQRGYFDHILIEAFLTLLQVLQNTLKSLLLHSYLEIEKCQLRKTFQNIREHPRKSQSEETNVFAPPCLHFEMAYRGFS